VNKGGDGIDSTKIAYTPDDVPSRVVTKSNYYNMVSLPKSGNHTISVEDGALFYTVSPSFVNLSDETKNFDVVLNNGIEDKTYTFEVKGDESVTIDLLSGRITVYVTNTGVIKDERKLNSATFSYKSIAFNNFDYILLENLQVTIFGRMLL